MVMMTMTTMIDDYDDDGDDDNGDDDARSIQDSHDRCRVDDKVAGAPSCKKPLTRSLTQSIHGY